jgi:competence protein ComEA
MPTPGERRALIFIAAVGALGVAVRGWKEFHPRDPAELAGSRTALARQIQAVDSAIAVSSSTRKARATRAPRQDTSRAAPPPRSPRARGRAPASQDTQPRDPRQAYWDRAARIDSAIRASDQSADERARSSRPQSADRRPPSQPPTAVRRPPSSSAEPPVDLDLADVDEIARISLIGPAVARRIVADRIEFGPFGSLAGLERIPGLTKPFIRRLAPFVTFSGAPRLGSAGERRPRSKSERRPGGESRP